MTLTREQLESLQPAMKKVPIPGTDEHVYVRTISARMREDFEDGLVEFSKTPDLPARLACLCLCDESGAYYYPDAQKGQEQLAETAAEMARKVPASVVEAIFFAGRDINRMSKDAREDAAKNSEATTDDSSNITLPDS